MTAPKQLTLRNPSPELSARLKALAEERSESVNTTALRLLERAVGIDGRRARFERLATATPEEVAELEEAIRDQRRIDPDLWVEPS